MLNCAAVPRAERPCRWDVSLVAAITEASVSGSVTTENEDGPRETLCLGLDVSCTYVLPDEALKILLAIVLAAHKSEEGQQPEAA